MYTGAEQCVITLNSFLSLILSCSSLSHDLSANKPQWNLQLNPPCFYLIHLTAAYRLLLQKPWVFPTSVACDLSTKKPTKSHVNKLNAKKKKKSVRICAAVPPVFSFPAHSSHFTTQVCLVTLERRYLILARLLVSSEGHNPSIFLLIYDIPSHLFSLLVIMTCSWLSKVCSRL